MTSIGAGIRSPIPPLVIRIGAAFVLGVLTTVAVAESLAMYVDAEQRTTLRQSRGFRLEIATQVIPTPPDSPQQEGTHFLQVKRYRRAGTDIVEVGPVWSQMPDAPAYGSPHALVQGTSFAAQIKEKLDRG